MGILLAETLKKRCRGVTIRIAGIHRLGRTEPNEETVLKEVH